MEYATDYDGKTSYTIVTMGETMTESNKVYSIDIDARRYDELATFFLEVSLPEGELTEHWKLMKSVSIYFKMNTLICKMTQLDFKLKDKLMPSNEPKQFLIPISNMQLHRDIYTGCKFEIEFEDIGTPFKANLLTRAFYRNNYLSLDKKIITFPSFYQTFTREVDVPQDTRTVRLYLDGLVGLLPIMFLETQNEVERIATYFNGHVRTHNSGYMAQNDTAVMMAPFNKIKYSGNFYPINYSLEMGNEKSFGPPVHRMDEHRVEITFAAGSPAKTTVTLGCCLVNPLTWYYGMNQFRYVYGGDLQRLLTEDEWRLIWDECRKKVDDNLLTRIAETAAAKPAPAKKSKFPGLCLWKT